MFVNLLPRNFDECKLPLIMKNNRGESLQEPDTDVVPHVTARCHYSAEPPGLCTSVLLFNIRDL